MVRRAAQNGAVRMKPSARVVGIREQPPRGERDDPAAVTDWVLPARRSTGFTVDLLGQRVGCPFETCGPWRPAFRLAPGSVDWRRLLDGRAGDHRTATPDQ